MTTTESTEYDILGRVTRQTDILGRVTTTSYSEDELTTTVTTPAGATTIIRINLDGSTAHISGTAQREVQYLYARSGNNLVTTTALADGSILAQDITNGFEQTIAQYSWWIHLYSLRIQCQSPDGEAVPEYRRRYRKHRAHAF